MEEFESFSRDWFYTEVQVFFVLENTNSVTWLVHCPGKNILNIKQREGGDPGLDWDQGPGPGTEQLWSHTLVIIRG